MTKNRATRRAETAVLPAMPQIPNISGTEESCVLCRFAASKTANVCRALNRAPPMPEDEVLCLRFPGGGAGMKSWGWCGEFAATPR